VHEQSPFRAAVHEAVEARGQQRAPLADVVAVLSRSEADEVVEKLHGLPESRGLRAFLVVPPGSYATSRFVTLLEAGDLPGLLALMLDNGSVEMPGALVETGRREFERTGSWFWRSPGWRARSCSPARPG
jgi:hypothetical protein